MNLDFFAAEVDQRGVLDFLFSSADARVCESYSEYDAELREFRSADELAAAFPLGTDPYNNGGVIVPPQRTHQMLRNLVLVTVALALLSACIGPAALPEATKEKVTPADIAGSWRYPADFGDTAITLELKPTGKFVQTIRRKGGRVQTHEGDWSLEDSRPTLNVLKPVFGKPNEEWVVEGARWWIVESHREGVRFAIFGAAEDTDPDSCNEFEKVR